MGEPEVITVAVVMAGQIIEVIIITNTISIMVMMMITSQSNMAHQALYVVDIITPPNIASRENMTKIILWRK